MENEYIIGSSDTLYDFVREQLLDVDTEALSDDVSDIINIDITPEKVYFWTRVYMKEENPNLQIGDEITIKYLPSGEEMKTQFFAYGKTGLERDHEEDELVNFNQEDDKKVVCLMVDEKIVNESDEIPFIRTLFKLGRHYEYNVLRREELVFTCDSNGVLIDWFDCDF